MKPMPKSKVSDKESMNNAFNKYEAWLLRNNVLRGTRTSMFDIHFAFCQGWRAKAAIKSQAKKGRVGG